MTENDYTNNQDPQLKARRETLDKLVELDQELLSEIETPKPNVKKEIEND